MDPGRARLALGIAMAVSIASTLYFGRGTTFSGDEMVWVAASPGFDLETAFQPHAGHLQAVSRTLYALLLELFGLDYLPYRVLTALAVCLAVALLFAYLARRVPPGVALGPCVVLLFFGSDHLHALQGNGFTIVFALAMGVLALIGFERDGLRWDLVAAVALSVGALTYSVALPFVAGIAVMALLGGSPRRLWVPAVPLAIYALWLLGASGTEDGSGSSLAAANLLLIPAWSFAAASASAASLSGLEYDFTSGGAVDLLSGAGPVLAIAAFASVGLALTRARDSALLATIATAFALWALEALAGRGGGGISARLPHDPRYLYPGALVLVLVLATAAAAARVRWSRAAIAGVLLVSAVGVMTNVMLLRDYGAFYREQASTYRTNVGVAAIVSSSTSARSATDPGAELARLPGGTLFAMVDSPYGRFGYGAEELLALPEPQRQQIDRVLALGSPVEVLRVPDGVREHARCRPAPSRGIGSGRTHLLVPIEGGVTTVALRRFADAPSVRFRLHGNREAIVVPGDGTPVPTWTVVSGGVRVCTR